MSCRARASGRPAEDRLPQGGNTAWTGRCGSSTSTGSAACCTATSAGRSAYNLPVNDVVGDKLLMTFVVSFTTIVFTYVVAFPIGIYSATHQYSWSDHSLTLLGFLGLATPNFLLALVMLYFANVYFGTSIGGLMDPQFMDKPWTLAKLSSVLAHLWIPVIVIGLSGHRRHDPPAARQPPRRAAEAVRHDGASEGRAAVPGADEISAAHGAQPVHLRYRLAAAARHLRRRRRSVVLNLPTTGPMLLEALRSQDMYLAGSFLMFLAFLTVIGVFISDLALAVLDPRIRLAGGVTR